MKRRALASALFLGAFLVNPMLLSGCNAVTFQFGEAEVVTLVQAAASAGPYRRATRDGDVEISFALVQAPGEDRVSAATLGAAVRPAHACGNRTFLRSAAACLTTTHVPVEGTLSIKSPTRGPLLDRLPVKGDLSVEGWRLDNAQLSLGAGGSVVVLRFRDGRPFVVDYAQVDGQAL